MSRPGYHMQSRFNCPGQLVEVDWFLALWEAVPGARQSSLDLSLTRDCGDVALC